MRLIFMVLSLTISALGFVYKEEVSLALLGSGPSISGYPATRAAEDSGSMMSDFVAKAQAALSGGQAAAPGSSPGMMGDMATALPDTAALQGEIEANIAAMNANIGESSFRATSLTPAMRGSSGARFVKARKSE